MRHSAAEPSREPAPRLRFIESLDHPDIERPLRNRGEKALPIRMQTEPGHVGSGCGQIEGGDLFVGSRLNIECRSDRTAVAAASHATAANTTRSTRLGLGTVGVSIAA